jgi:hypothetical protein
MPAREGDDDIQIARVGIFPYRVPPPFRSAVAEQPFPGGPDPPVRHGIYLLVFLVILLVSTIVGGPIPDNTLLLLAGAVASGDGLSMELLLSVAMVITPWIHRYFTGDANLVVLIKS